MLLNLIEIKFVLDLGDSIGEPQENANRSKIESYTDSLLHIYKSVAARLSTEVSTLEKSFQSEQLNASKGNPDYTAAQRCIDVLIRLKEFLPLSEEESRELDRTHARFTSVQEAQENTSDTSHGNA